MSFTLTVQVDGKMPELDWPAAMGAWSKTANPLGLGMLRARAPFRTGALRQSIDSETEITAGTATIGYYSTVPYAPYVVGGTRPHVIEARNARALRWFGQGGIGVNFAKRVNHPGTKPNLFPREAGTAVAMSAFGMFVKSIREELEID